MDSQKKLLLALKNNKNKPTSWSDSIHHQIVIEQKKGGSGKIETALKPIKGAPNLKNESTIHQACRPTSTRKKWRQLSSWRTMSSTNRRQSAALQVSTICWLYGTIEYDSPIIDDDGHRWQQLLSSRRKKESKNQQQLSSRSKKKSKNQQQLSSRRKKASKNQHQSSALQYGSPIDDNGHQDTGLGFRLMFFKGEAYVWSEELNCSTVESNPEIRPSTSSKSRHINASDNADSISLMEKSAGKTAKLYSCTICSFETRLFPNLMIHIRKHRGGKPFCCEIGDYKCTHSSYRIHWNGEKPFSCAFCEYKCNDSVYLTRHLLKHTGENPFSCEFCEYECIDSGSLTRHLELHGRKLFCCKFCDYKCFKSNTFKNHLGIHSGGKPHSYLFCEYKCNDSVSLTRHLEKHTGEYPFSCEFCDYECMDSGSLTRHLKLHSQKPIRCRLCDYKCFRLNTLKNHLRTHSGVKPHSCKLVEYKFLGSGQPTIETSTQTTTDSCYVAGSGAFKTEYYSEYFGLLAPKLINDNQSNAIQLPFRLEENTSMMDKIIMLEVELEKANEAILRLCKLGRRRLENIKNLKESSVRIWSDSHGRGLTNRLSGLLPAKTGCYSHVAPGAPLEMVMDSMLAPTEIEATEPGDFVVLLGGSDSLTADYYSQDSIDNFMARLIKVVNEYKHSHLILSTIPYRYDQVENSETNIALNRVNRAIRNIPMMYPNFSISLVSLWAYSRSLYRPNSHRLRLNKKGKSKLAEDIHKIILNKSSPVKHK